VVVALAGRGRVAAAGPTVVVVVVVVGGTRRVVVAVVGRGRAVVVVRFVSGTAGRSQAALTPAELRWICQPRRTAPQNQSLAQPDGPTA
jgi:hypothetical protein